jgi:D-threo-aldose 1-dehydrogenase
MSVISIVPLGKSGIEVSNLGFGSAPIGGLYSDIDQSRAIETIQYGLEQGITLFDTAPLYGQGRSEELLGHALAGVPRDSFVLSTKVGRVLDMDSRTLSFDYSRDGVMRSLEGSLKRLKLDHVDILHIHDPDNHQDEALDEAFPTLDDLRSQGVIRAIGAGMNQWEALDRFARNAEFDCFLLAGRYTLLEQRSMDFLEMCREKGIGILLGGVFNSGILATGPVQGAKYNYQDAPQPVLDHARNIHAVCERHGVALPAAALQFARANPCVTTLVVGAVSPQEIEMNLASLDTSIPAEFWHELREKGLISSHAPLPVTG